jgi:hypothetical protein
VAEWWLESPRVLRALAGKPPRPEGKTFPAEVSWVSNVGQFAADNPGRARAVQQAVREQLHKYFAERLVITGVAIGEEENRYLLNPEIEAELSTGDFEWRRKNASDFHFHED